MNNHCFDAEWLPALRIIIEVSSRLGQPIMVIGASARDILLRINQLSPIRATRDLDLAIEIASWDGFAAMHESLIASGYFVADDAAHRLTYSTGLPVDLIPYGGVTDAQTNISWPPDHEISMSVLGVKDAFDASFEIPLGDEPDALRLNVVSPAGLVLLKIFAWEERKSVTRKDAEDIYHLVDCYISLGNRSALEQYHVDLFDEIETANARLLARDLFEICSDNTLSVLDALLSRETEKASMSQLLRDMLPRHADSDLQSRWQRKLLSMKKEINYLSA